MRPSERRFYLGAYAASPSANGWSRDDESTYFEGLRKLDSVAGLELPFFGAVHPQDPAWLLGALDPAWDVVFTMIPGVMQTLAKDPHFGLASEDEEGRRRAVGYCRLARVACAMVNEAAGRSRVRGVEIHSAPTQGRDGVRASVKALTRSLQEIRSWDWGAAALYLEHCDAFVPEQEPSKGFLPVEEELAALAASDAAGSTECSLLLNWGRSAIEGRDALHPVAHARAATAAGKLGAVFFSGATVDDPLYGTWNDSHAPFDAEGSLLRGAALAEFARTVHGVPLVGLKMQALPKTLSVADRITFVGRQLTMLHEIFPSP